DQRGLPRPVRAHQRINRPVRYCKPDAAQRLGAAESLREPIGPDLRAPHGPAHLPRRIHLALRPPPPAPSPSLNRSQCVLIASITSSVPMPSRFASTTSSSISCPSNSAR